MKHHSICGGVVLNEEGEVVVVHQDGLTWSLPKGRVERGESPLQAARREIFEESGLKDLKYVKKLGSYERYKMTVDGGDDKSARKHITIFLFRTDKRKLVPQESNTTEARWIKKEQVPKILTHYKDKNFFDNLLRTKTL
jgi:ADP-ribose pyrophosphatase YjhB (NUDIX family)